MSCKVTICCVAYQHEKYIRKALDGFLNQKTDFEYKILVHDDASKDGTQAIIKEYEKRYPGKIFAVCQSENKMSKGIGVITEYLLPHVEGEYIALCEGDDYWTDLNKLQKQVDGLDLHRDCYLSSHRTVEVYEDETPTGFLFPKNDIPSGVIKSSDALSLPYSFHTSSLMFRLNEWKNYMLNKPEFRKVSDVGDIPYIMYFANLGNVYYINENMSCYRRGVPTSWSMTERNNYEKNVNYEKLIRHPHCMYLSYKLFDDFSEKRFHNICMYNASRYLLQETVLTKNTITFFSKENRELFSYLPCNRKIYALLAILAPSIMRKIYLKRLARLNKRINKNTIQERMLGS